MDTAGINQLKVWTTI